MNHRKLDSIVYTSVRSFDADYIIDPWEEFNNQVKSRNYENLKFEHEIIEGETHLSVFPQALTKGLKFVLNQ